MFTVNCVLERVFMTIAGECSRIFWHIKWNVPGRNGSVLTAGIQVPKPAAAVET